MTDSTLDLSRLLRPRSIAVVGGAWGRNVVEQCAHMQFDGNIWPVHPTIKEVHGYPCFQSIDDLPARPDACFIGVNRHLTIDIVKALAINGAGGAVCFASGFSEAAAEDDAGVELQEQLLEATLDMPIIGPNCYGLINYLDGALLWPDQHGGRRVSSGVAIITQSSNIAISMTMQRRGLPISYVMTAGNQAKVGLADMASALLDDERVTAIGLHIEGFGNIDSLQQFAEKAARRGIGVVVIKAGKTEHSQAAMVSHTNSLAGTDTAASALIERLGFARVNSIPSFLESLKLLHCCGPLPDKTVASMSCSGGEASLMADALGDRPLDYPLLSDQQSAALRLALGPMVALANPLDYHTYIWNDVEAMTATFSAMLQTPAAMTFLVIDFPRSDACKDEEWWLAVEALLAAREATSATVAVLSTLPENMPESLATHLMQKNVPAIGGVGEALDAVVAAYAVGAQAELELPLLHSHKTLQQTHVLSEYDAKTLLKASGLPVATAVKVASVAQAVDASLSIHYPLVIKVSGIAHKTEQGGVVLNVQNEAALREHCERLFKLSDDLLIEPYFHAAVAELLVGVVREPDGLFKLTIGAGGVLTELLHDTVSLLLPVSEAMLSQRLGELKVAAMLNGYRGQPGADMTSVINTILQLCQWVEINKDAIAEIEINPLLCMTDKTQIVDALITASQSNLEKL